MVLSFPIPQDVIDTILYKLRYQYSTLKQCSLVSRSFYPTSRKLLFGIVRLYNQQRCQQFLHLLTNNSYLSSFVKELYIISNSPYPPDPKKHWIIEDTTLPLVLNVLSSLRSCTLYSGACLCEDVRLSWRDFSDNLDVALWRLFQSRDFTDLTIDRIHDIPGRYLNRLGRLKLLSLSRVSFDPHTPPRKFIEFEHTEHNTLQGYLDSFKIMGCLEYECTSFQDLEGFAFTDFLIHPQAPLQFSKMREVYIQGGDELINIGWRMVTAAAKSLELFAWDVEASARLNRGNAINS
ncbi:hypothetical protein BYT27DRAFT_6749562 [Phlegmacium glaucopus]|nr:hypothetical protein BYT27DRAFT_6749562 [Phlegmacium glaucopus]